MRIYLLLGHPDGTSFCGAIADAYQAAALAAGHQVERQDVGALQFDPILHHGYKAIQPLEPDLLRAQELIGWCEHWVIVYPIWWGSVPALLKGFFDRTLLPGQAFEPHAHDMLWDKLLAGRSAQLFTTSDAPNLWTLLAYRNSDLGTVKHAVLRYCGIKPVRAMRFDRMKGAEPARLARYLERVRAVAGR